MQVPPPERKKKINTLECPNNPLELAYLQDCYEENGKVVDGVSGRLVDVDKQLVNISFSDNTTKYVAQTDAALSERSGRH